MTEASQKQAAHAVTAAQSPLSIPARGWLAAVGRVCGQFGRDTVVLISGGVAFFAILSAAPALTAMMSVYGLFFDPAQAARHARLLYGVLPGEAYVLFESQLQRIVEASDSTLAAGLALSLIAALGMANSGMRQFCIALTKIHNETIDRPLPAQFAISLTLTVGAILAFLAAAVVVAATPIWLRYVWLGDAEPALIAGRWIVLFMIAAVYAMVIYHYGPDRRRPRWRWVWPGAIIAAGAWVAMSIGLAFVIRNASNIEALYGPLAGVIVLMLWTFFSTLVFLLGAELNVELERQTFSDTTVGEERTLGERDAMPADEFGPHPDMKALRRRAAKKPIPPR